MHIHVQVHVHVPKHKRHRKAVHVKGCQSKTNLTMSSHLPWSKWHATFSNFHVATHSAQRIWPVPFSEESPFIDTLASKKAASNPQTRSPPSTREWYDISGGGEGLVHESKTQQKPWGGTAKSSRPRELAGWEYLLDDCQRQTFLYCMLLTFFREIALGGHTTYVYSISLRFPVCTSQSPSKRTLASKVWN